MRYEAVLFDLEGTIVDFQWRTDKAIEQTLGVLKDFGFDMSVFNGCDYASLYNKAIDEAEKRGLRAEKVRKAMDQIYDAVDNDALQRWVPKDDTKNTLRGLRDRGFGTALVSNVGNKAVRSVLSRFDLNQFLDVVITRNSVKRLKPECEGIILALEKLGVGKDSLLFVGDSITDILTCRAAGVEVAIVLGGEHRKEELERYKPDFILPRLGEVFSVL